MPNFFFMGVHFFYLSSLCLWVGGSTVIAFVVAPLIFKGSKSRTEAGRITGEILKRFDRVILFCIAVLIGSSMMKFHMWENPTVWFLSRYVLIFTMALNSLISQFIISPKMRTLKQQIYSFGNDSDEHPNWIKFKNLHKISAASMLANIFMGGAVLFLS